MRKIDFMDRRLKSAFIVGPSDIEGFLAGAHVTTNDSNPFSIDNERLQLRIGGRCLRLSAALSGDREHKYEELGIVDASDMHTSQDGTFPLTNNRIYLFDLVEQIPNELAEVFVISASLVSWSYNLRCRLIWIIENDVSRAWIEVVALTCDVSIPPGTILVEGRLMSCFKTDNEDTQATQDVIHLFPRQPRSVNDEPVLELTRTSDLHCNFGRHPPLAALESKWKPVKCDPEGIFLRPGRLYKVPIEPWRPSKSTKCYTILPQDVLRNEYQRWRSLFVPMIPVGNLASPLCRLIVNSFDLPFLLSESVAIASVIGIDVNDGNPKLATNDSYNELVSVLG